ncbi:bifunctional enoyl-CoA hydratase/phosphate acetyltransferase [Frigidibacter sp. MR17.24]|uniref:bifunctional enoyl-CoA hydratase/phosphate acetyltransferase n=1 Tax=Frigidibacter sp. MR17.24 TaxID=3127345 RepID=UPI003FA5AA05
MPAATGEAALIENRTFDEIAPGDHAEMTRAVTADDIELFAIVSGDVNPAHLDADYAAGDVFHRVIAHGMFGAGLISAVLGTRLPGPGTIYLSQELRFRAPVGIGDVITAAVTVVGKEVATGTVTLDCRCTDAAGRVVIEGRAKVLAPRTKVSRPRVELREVQLGRRARFDQLMARATGGGAPAPIAIAHPCDGHSIRAAVEAAAAGLIAPLLVGPAARIRAAAEAAGADIAAFEIVEAPHSEAAAARAVALVREGRADFLMKGSLHTDELLRAVLAPEGLRTGRRLSHVYLMDVPRYPKPLLVTDAAVNIAPDLAAKRDIVQNAIDLAHVMGLARPKVAILSAVETVNPDIPSTLDAAALCKMADRGQISGALVDGPLAFDNAVSPKAAADKGITSAVAGEADILMVPDLESGNMLAKQLTFLAGAEAAGVVLGARVPIVLTSRADSDRARLASCAVAVLVARARAGTGAGTHAGTRAGGA